MLSLGPPPDGVTHLGSVRELNGHGYRHVVVELIAQGREPRDVVAYLQREFSVEVPVQVVAQMFSVADRKAMMTEADAVIRRRLRQMAIEEMEHLREGFRRAEADGNEKLMAQYASLWQSWWDRVGRLFFLQEDKPSTQVNVIVADPLRIVREEVTNPDDAAKIIARLEAEEARREAP